MIELLKMPCPGCGFPPHQRPTPGAACRHCGFDRRRRHQPPATVETFPEALLRLSSQALLKFRDTVGPSLAGRNAEQLIGSERMPLLHTLSSGEVVGMAVLEGWLRAMADAMLILGPGSGTTQSVDLVLETMRLTFAKFLDGYMSPPDPWEFVAHYHTRTEWFGARCSLTSGLAIELCLRFDAAAQTNLLDTWLDVRKQLGMGVLINNHPLSNKDHQVARTLHSYELAVREEQARFTARLPPAQPTPPSLSAPGSTHGGQVDPVASTWRSDSVSDQNHSSALVQTSQSNLSDPAGALRRAHESLQKLVGLASIKEEVQRFEALLHVRRRRQEAGLSALQQTLHFVFTGNPGTGKTTVARVLAQLLFGYGVLRTDRLIETDRAGLVGGYLGQTAEKTDTVLRSALDGVLFVDEAYALARDDQDAYGLEAIDTLLKRMEDDRDRLVVVVAGYPTPMAKFLASNPGLESRFTRHMAFTDYGVAELLAIYRGFAREGDLELAPGAQIALWLLFSRHHRDRTERFGNGRLVRNIFEETLTRQAVRLADISRSKSTDRESLRRLFLEDIPSLVSGGWSTQRWSDAVWTSSCSACGATHKVRTPQIGRSFACLKCRSSFTADISGLYQPTVDELLSETGPSTSSHETSAEGSRCPS